LTDHLRVYAVADPGFLDLLGLATYGETTQNGALISKFPVSPFHCRVDPSERYFEPILVL
jgi:hypothetical protein